MNRAISVQVRSNSAAGWVTVRRTDEARIAAGHAITMAKKHAMVRVVDGDGRVRLEYDLGERVDRPARPITEPYRERQTRLANRARDERKRIDALRAHVSTPPLRTVVINGQEWESVWDGRGPIPGSRLEDWP